jgi:hypothetical protein
MTAMQVLQATHIRCRREIQPLVETLLPPPPTPPLLCEQDETNDRHTSLQTGPAPPRPVLCHRPAVSPAGPVLRRPSSSALPSLASRLVAAVPPPPLARTVVCCPSAAARLDCSSLVHPTTRLHRSSATPRLSVPLPVST